MKSFVISLPGGLSRHRVAATLLSSSPILQKGIASHHSQYGEDANPTAKCDVRSTLLCASSTKIEFNIGMAILVQR